MARANDIAWEKYLAKTQTKLDGRSYVIRADQLKVQGDREARLMAKFDEPGQLPNVFEKAGYSILAIANGKYLLFKGNIFASVPECQFRSLYMPKLDFSLNTASRGSGEPQYIDNAFNTGLLSEFTQSGKLYLTIRGRERTKRFDFRIDEIGLSISVDGAQIEVDAGYESERDIIILEGKIGNRSRFNIRQLYYPFRHFSQLVPHKKVRTLFFSYDLKRATYSFHEFGFSNPEVFDSIYPLACCVYSLTQGFSFAVDDLMDPIYESNNNIIPQADDLNKILEMLTLINNGQNTVAEITDHFVFDIRQSNYYGEAAESLGLITRKRGVFELTERGFQFIASEPQNQRLFILKLVVNSWYFKELIRKAKRKGYFLDTDVIRLVASVEKDSGDKRYTKSTIGRRVKTIKSWSKWIGEEFKSFGIEADKVILK